MTTLRWKVSRSSQGFGPRHELRAGMRTIVTVTEATPGCWYWFGLGVSTRHRPTDLPSAKAEAHSHAFIAFEAANRAEARSKGGQQ